MPPLHAPDYDPPTGPPELVHVDHDLLVVVKPDGLLSVPGKGPALADCLIARLQAAYPGVLLVHRLDRDTSGVMIFARNPNAQRHLGLQFEKRHTKKRYVARVEGRVQGDGGRVDLPLIVDWPNRPLQRIDHDEGRPAQTDWQVIDRSDTESRVSLTPITGRSHQLRVHMLSLGHPILGDTLYAQGPARDHPRMMLHAELLELRHPAGGRWMRFEAPAPF
ncbi:ribosomal large subunit pseudouridine synthase A [Palleronia marisminoris]|uniref:Dual-specificity RNA pseudouridine synthase RluA n=1 Tax=Palleronia marisminoris TaxID=315423 RepID=A0A1Y5SQ34_9RHOB|nr:pseudouridine synthase [Palleronia marisminoris]SFG86424.1 ribosomal large subunit pseudouridine synthase A [Palleronia marisminoris]SLN42768.1 Ribosomal large subunit pseudouridine synthase A [Palleronia marisminoris]